MKLSSKRAVLLKCYITRKKSKTKTLSRLLNFVDLFYSNAGIIDKPIAISPPADSAYMAQK